MFIIYAILVDIDGMANSQDCPDDWNRKVLLPDHWRSLAPGNSQAVKEGGVWSSNQDGSFFSGRLFSLDLDSKSQQEEGKISHVDRQQLLNYFSPSRVWF